MALVRGKQRGDTGSIYRGSHMSKPKVPKGDFKIQVRECIFNKIFTMPKNASRRPLSKELPQA